MASGRNGDVRALADRSPVANGTGVYISQVARILGISPAMIRLWEREGLVAPHRTPSGYRVFAPDTIEQVRRVRDLIRCEGLNVAGAKRALQRDPLIGPSRRMQEDSEAPNIGVEIRRLRTEQGMSLRELAKRTGLSPSYVSSVERSLRRPSVATLQKLASALGTHIAAMLGDRPIDPHDVVVRRERRRRLRLDLPGILMEQLTTKERELEPTYMRIEPGAGIHQPYQHEGEEFVFILAGVLEITIDGSQTHVLREGDAITFASQRPHSWRNPGPSPSRLIWVNTPPTF
jgi:transcriptional regulator with XRE-family HTH domain